MVVQGKRAMPHRHLLHLAWINVVLHLLGLVLAGLGMRPGSPLVELAARQEYVAQSPPLWWLGWSIWMLCALALVCFFAALGSRFPERSSTTRLALALAASGAAVDLFCDAIYITVLPTVAD